MDAANVGKEEHILILLYYMVWWWCPLQPGLVRPGHGSWTQSVQTLAANYSSPANSSIIIHQFIIYTNCAFLTWYLVEYSTKTNTTGNVIN